MPKFDSLGDRMKWLESNLGNLPQSIPYLPLIIRLDGKAFHTFTRGLDRPYDLNLIELMTRTTKFLVEETNAVIGYTQSDEITLILYSDDINSQLYFDGRIAKINSVLASTCTLYFNRLIPSVLPSKQNTSPVFDCRCFNVPNKSEAVNAIVWREQDAVRNSIQMAGQAQFSHTQLDHKSCDEIQEMLFQHRGINWDQYPAKCKRGTYIQKRKVKRKFDSVELSFLPLKHEARTNPDLEIERNEFNIIKMPPISKVINQEEVFFQGADPKVLFGIVGDKVIPNTWVEAQETDTIV